jgi:hypothetical protein
MGLYFVFAALVQLNDPDAAVWAVFYALAAAVTLFAVRRPPPACIPAVLAGAAMLWSLILLPTAFTTRFGELFQTWNMMSDGMEVGREFIGLIIVGAWMAVLAQRSRRPS